MVRNHGEDGRNHPSQLSHHGADSVLPFGTASTLEKTQTEGRTEAVLVPFSEQFRSPGQRKWSEFLNI